MMRRRLACKAIIPLSASIDAATMRYRCSTAAGANFIHSASSPLQKCASTMTAASSCAISVQRAGYVAAPTAVLRQGLSVVKQSLDPETTLLARGGYTLFVLAHVGDSSFGLYCPTTSKFIALNSTDVAAAVAFLGACAPTTDDDARRFAGGSIIFPEDNSAVSVNFCQAIKKQSHNLHRVVIGPDAWSIVFDSFRAQKEHVRALTLPEGFEHASVLMSNKRFVPLNIPQGFKPTSATGNDIAAAALTSQDVDGAVNSTARRALVVWDALLGVHKRFGVVGSKKLLNPIDAVVRRAVKAVNIFGVDLDNRLGRGSVVEGITMVATIYNAQTGTNTVHQIRNLSDETIKLNTLTTLLYGEGTSSMTVLIPSPRTKEQQLLMFARVCKPKCPFFVIQPQELAPIFSVPAASFNFTETNDPKGPKTCKRDFATQQQIASGAAHHHSSSTTASATSPSGDGTTSPSPPSTPPPPANRPVFLNNVTRDTSVAIALEAWVNNIYKNEARLQREQAAQRSIARYLIVDLETTTKKRYKRIANPFTKENHIVMSGALDYQGNMFMPEEYFTKEVSQAYHDQGLCAKNFNVKGSSSKSLFLPPLDGYDVLVGHNFKFDLLHLWQDAELRAFLKRGGKIWDTMYGEYLLTGHQVKLGRGAGLEDVAKSYGGQIPKLDEVKQAWATGKQTYDIPYATLKEYLIGDLKNTALIFGKHLDRALVQRQVIICNAPPNLDEVKQAWATGKQTYDIPYATLKEYLIGDLKNTSLIFGKHLDRALVQRQVIICNARMDSLLATTEMEFNGLKTDVPLAVKQSNELVGKAVALRQDLDSYIPDEIPPKLRKFYNWASNQMLIPYFFGGKVKLNTANRESKPVTGEKTSRHLVFSTEDVHYPTTSYPTGVYLSSVQNVAGAGDCVVVTSSGDAEKGTRVFTTCIDAYMKMCGFRKSSTLADSMSKVLVPISRATGTIAGPADAIANLLPERVVFLYAGVELDANTKALKQLVFLQSDTKQETVLDCVISPSNTAATIAAKFEEYLRSVATTSTLALLPADDMIDPSMTPDAFATAQIIIVARDAPFSFRRALDEHSPELRAAIARRTGDVVEQKKAAPPLTSDAAAAATTEVVVPSAGNAASLNLADRFALSFADATSTMLFYYAQYSDDVVQAYDSKSKKWAAVDPNWIVKPEWIPVPKGKNRLPMLPFIVEKEEHEAPLAWCRRYRDMFEHIAQKTYEYEAKQPLEPKKARKNSPPPKADEALPLLLRRRPAIQSGITTMDPSKRGRLTLMMLFGRLAGTSHDAIVEPSAFSDTVEVPLKGKLSFYFKQDSSREMDLITAKFRSPLTRQLQVGDDSLTYFSKTHKDPAAGTIMELRGMEKLLGTYYEHTEGGTGMVSLTHSIDSCIHHELVHNKTNTGRLASSNPNCQNIPKEDKSPLREMFVSRFAPHGKCIEVDYSQLEVITLAALSNDRQMIEDLKNNIDFHCKRVTMIRPDLSYDEVVLRAKKNKEPEFVKLRQQAKIFSFQRQYGAGVTMLSESTGLAPDQVRQLIEGEKVLYQGCDQFTNMVTLSANNYDASLQDGNRNIRGHQVYKGMFPVITGSRYVFTESDMPESMLRDKPASTKSTNFSPTHIKNYPVQGFAGEIVQIMLGCLWRHFVECNNYNGKALLTNTVHDCVWVDATEEVYLQVSNDVERILSSAREQLDHLFPEMKCGVSFGVDVVAGENMCHLRPLPKEKK
ncbi:mitochondrial DNA polymerase I protein D, putative [Bodo saltans]|uniref:DNA-directed DNA polymerase n=1 Tax=Bodo saltans TaxID=75058 RepID=A0A0S4IR82_BODSA|nr:mitochondrial DNA polymerase I protein D, putative [Bodo saltans]|eukprot:CUF02065.1 mitochondrial DNA polymerase I protein D, putative [Bodo saltans]